VVDRHVRLYPQSQGRRTCHANDSSAKACQLPPKIAASGREIPSALSYTIIGARLCYRGSHHGAIGHFSGFIGVESRARRQARPRGIAASRCCTLTADGGGAADAATNLHRALHLRSSRAVAVAGEVADLQSAREQVASRCASVSSRTASARRSAASRCRRAMGLPARTRRCCRLGTTSATARARARRRWKPSLAASCPASGRRSK
jgi:hypothetical protein